MFLNILKQWNFLFVFIASFLLVNCSKDLGNSFEVYSPNGVNKIKFELKNSTPFYAVSHDASEVINDSKLGFIFGNNNHFNTNFEVVKATRKSVDKTWEQVWGEQQFIRDNHNELSVVLREKTEKKRELEIQFRAFDDGIAFRYVFNSNKKADSLHIMNELSEFVLANSGDAWWIPAYEDNRYEYLYEKSKVEKLDKVHTPLTIKSENGLYLSFHEANLTNYASMTLVKEEDKTLSCDLVPWSDGVKVKTNGAFKTPWRTIQIAETPGELITSYLILNLNEPNKLEDTSYIKPSKYLGIWWGMHISKYTFWESEKHGASTKNSKKYIDWAKELGVNKLLIEGWNVGWTPAWYENLMHKFSFTQSTPDFNLEEVVNYGNENGVKLIGYHETGSNLINYLHQIDDGMALYKDLGIHDIKIGQVGSRLNMKEWHHGQFGVNYYRTVLEKAAKYKLAVNFHEPIKDTGERRTYPNMMSREGARGMEYNAWSDGNPPNHTLILAFTRMLSGPMDYTPGIFDIYQKQGLNNRQVHTTLAKQLAYYVTLYSPIQMLADLPDNYIGHPAFKFLADVPVDWAETHVLNGEIGAFLTTVRKDKYSENWYLGSMTNEEGRNIKVDLSFLDENVIYEAQIYEDAEGITWKENATEINIETEEVVSTQSINLKLAPGGGAAIRFVKK